jgi:signal transduction histidine kinase
MKLLDVLIPKRISGQIAAIVVISIVVIHAILTTIFFLNRPDDRDRERHPEPGQLTALIQMLGAVPRSDRGAMIATMQRTFPRFELRPAGAEERFAGPPQDRAGGPPPPFLRHLDRDYRVLMAEGPPDTGRMAVVLPDGDTISFLMPPDRGRPPFWGGPVMSLLLFMLVILSLLGMWAARALAAPLSSLAKAAETFSLDQGAAPLPERGPEEIRSVARALNAMRRRISALVDDRTKMLAAISHDLRTPITRMRLRTEFIDDDASRTQMLRDLDQMRSMLDSVLTFLRNDGQLEPLTLTDIATTLQSIADQFADVGQPVSYHGPAHATVTARPGDLQRAVSNLVENAVRFAGEVKIGLTSSPGAVVIEVEDDGPGISDAQKSAMLQPFVRGDDARNMDQASGFGLGLSIAHAVTLTHGGELSLNDREPHGLIVRIKLPRSGDAPSR